MKGTWCSTEIMRHAQNTMNSVIWQLYPQRSFASALGPCHNSSWYKGLPEEDPWKLLPVRSNGPGGTENSSTQGKTRVIKYTTYYTLGCPSITRTTSVLWKVEEKQALKFHSSILFHSTAPILVNVTSIIVDSDRLQYQETASFVLNCFMQLRIKYAMILSYI